MFPRPNGCREFRLAKDKIGAAKARNQYTIVRQKDNAAPLEVNFKMTSDDFQDLIEIAGASQGLTKRGQRCQVLVQQAIVDGERCDLRSRKTMIEIGMRKSGGASLVVDLEKGDHVLLAIDDWDGHAGSYAQSFTHFWCNHRVVRRVIRRIGTSMF